MATDSKPERDVQQQVDLFEAADLDEVPEADSEAPAGDRVFGQRLPDNSVALTAEDAAGILGVLGETDLAPAEWLAQFTDLGGRWQGDRMIISDTLAAALELPVPPPLPPVAPDAGQGLQARTVAELLGLGEENEIVRYQQAVAHDGFDREMFDDLVASSTMLRDNVQAGQDLLKTWDQLAFDLWNLVYKVEPKIRAEYEMDPAYLVNHYLVNYALQTEGFAELREMAAGSLTDSILGFEVVAQDVLGYVRRCLEEYEEQKRQAQEQYEQAMQEFLDTGGDPNDPNAPQNPVNAQGIMLPGPGGGTPHPGALIAMANQMASLQQARQQAADMAQAAQELSQQLQRNGQSLPPDMQQALADAQAQQQQVQQQLQDLTQQAQQASADLQSQLQRALDQAARNAMTKTQPVRKWLDGWGLGGGNPRPQNVRMRLDDVRRAVERIRYNKDFQKFAKLLGRFRQIALADVKRRSEKHGVAIKDVRVSNDVQNALASEYALLGNKALESEFYRKFAEGQLLTYVKENTDAKGKGPGIICLDVSGSMHGTKIQWAKAVVLSLVEVFQKQNRDVIVVAFEYDIKGVWVFQKDRLDPNDLLDIANIEADGGTNFQEPLQIAMEAIIGRYEHEKVKAAIKKANLTSHRFKKADIIFITDGDYMFPDVQFPPGIHYWDDLTDKDLKAAAKTSSFLKRYQEIKDDKEFVCRAVLINTDRGASDRAVRMFADKVITLEDISDLSEAKAAEIFAEARGLDDASVLMAGIDRDDDDDTDDDDD